ncbi:MAG: hypothetical protein Q4C55_00870 [Eubacterium sp.]|nr:hypothetical protein [Eubacterium sp.]
MEIRPGRKWIKAASVIMLIIGICGIVVSAAGIVGYSQMDANMAADMETIGISVAAQKTQLAVSGAVYLAQLVAAVIGLASLNYPERDRLCLGAGIVILACHLGNLIYGVLGSGFSLIALAGFVLAAVFPAIYCLGAFKNLKAGAED